MTANFRNRTLYRGDNLEFLRGMNSETVDLVATDPPFNKGRDFHATPDSLASGAKFHDRWSWDKDIEDPWREQIRTDWPAVWEVIDAANHTWGRDMGAFLCYMGVRLMEMHRLLKPTGSLYLHCDDTAGAYLVMMMDAIFGRRNRRAIITWKRYGSHNDAKNYGRVYDTLLFYAKDQKQAVWEGAFVDLDEEYVEKNYTMDDRDGRGAYMTGPLHASKGHSGRGYDYTFRGYTRTWRYPEAGMRKLEQDGRIYQGRGGKGVPRRKIYLADSQGKPVGNLWDDIEGLNWDNEESTGYPTQKPVVLYRRIIDASSNAGDIVLDPFCGCATTLIAAEQAGRQWVGIDLWDEALTVVQERLDKECGNIEQGKLWSGTVFTSDTPPARTDDGAIAAPPLKTKKKGAMRSPEPGPVLPRAEMIALLIKRQEGKCAGCDRRYEDERIWQIDHLNPRSAGGVNHDSNRCLLCPPCNGIKSDTMTLTALRKHNAKNGLMA